MNSNQTILDRLGIAEGADPGRRYPDTAPDAMAAPRRHLYYFHRHEAPSRGEEAGHFHIFVAAPLQPVSPVAGAAPVDGNDWSHVAGISIDHRGDPQSIFTTNQWVTSETWACASMVLERMDGFSVDGLTVSPEVDAHVAQLVAGLAPLLPGLLHDRDERLTSIWRSSGTDPCSDRRLEIISERPLSPRDRAGLARATS